MAILPNLAQENATQAARIAQLEAALAAASRPNAITLKVTAPRKNEKTGQMEGTSGALSIYGLGRFPITLYRSQWERLFKAIPQVEAFIEDNADLLAVKP